MEHKLTNFEKLPVEVQRVFIPYLNDLISIHQDNCISAFIYGSGTGKSYFHNVSNINSGLILRKLDFSSLTASLKIVSKGLSQKIVAPLFLTKEYIQSSLDVFPIEFLEVKENHILLYGEDVLPSLKIPEQYIKLFCEQQVKGKLIRVRQAFLENGLNKKAIESILKDSLQALWPVFRNLIRLKGVVPGHHKEEILQQITQRYALDRDVFVTVYNAMAKVEKIPPEKLNVLFGLYIAELEKLASQLDRS